MRFQPRSDFLAEVRFPLMADTCSGVSAIIWNAVRDERGISALHQWNAQVECVDGA